MLMVMDIGNTNIVVGVHDGKEWIAHWRLSSSRSRTSDEFGIILGSMFQAGGVDMKAVKDIIVSTVVPPLLVPLCNMCKRYFGITPFVVTSNCNTGLKLDYDHPNEIGADRIVNAVAAHHMYGDKGNLIIIDFGTATTFCALRPDGEYLGGAIAPGIGISTEALFQKAAKLPRIELIKPKMAICHDTIHAMRSGVIFGFVGQMDGIITRMKKELGGQAFVVVTGGFGKLLKVGADAQAMLGRTPGNIIAIRPLREGVISDYEVTERMIKEFLHKVMGFQLFKPRIIICVPSGITEVEERAVIDAGIQAGARRVYLIEEPVAAAIGAGIDITQPEGHMIIDIGGGTSDIAVISLSGVVESSSIKIAGDQFNEAVVKYMRRKHNLLVGERTAEQMKMQIGCVFPPEEEMTMEVKGRSLITGLPELISVSSAEMLEAFEEPVERIMEEVHLVLEKTPPELVADISNNGIVKIGRASCRERV